MKKIQITQKNHPKPELVKLLESPEVRSWRALMGAFKYIFAELERGLMKEDCSVSRFQILFYLYMEGPHSAVSIARKLLVTRGNISTFLKRMEQDGLIRPALPEGQKRPLFGLTEKGSQFFEKIFPRHIERVRGLAPALKLDMIRTLESVEKS